MIPKNISGFCTKEKRCGSIKMVERNRHSVKIFYSYAHKDRELREELARYLGEEHISGWYDREIYPGTDWEKDIDANLEAADIVLLLISVDFMQSTYCVGKEMKRALERAEEKSAYVIPIIMRPVFWKNAPFSQLQVLPEAGKPVITWDNREVAYVEITESIHRIIDRVLTKQHLKDAEEDRRAGRLEDALIAYKRAVRYAPEDANLQEYIGDVLILLGYYRDALEVYEKAIALEPANDRFFMKKGDALKRLDSHAAALTAYQNAKNLGRNDFSLYTALGDTFFALHSLQKALNEYSIAARLRPDDYQIYMNQAKVLLELSQYQAVLNACKVAERLNSSDAQVFKYKGKALCALKNYAGALDAYAHAIALQPRDPDLHMDRGDVFVKQGESLKALQDYEMAANLDDSNALFWRDIGDTLRNLGRLSEAHSAYEKAIARQPANPIFYKNSADILFKLQRFQEALGEYDRAIEYKDDIADWYDARASTKDKIAEAMVKDAQRDRMRARQIRQPKNSRNTRELK
jgi:tetratricopeptide (TPR) repeat protein